MVKANIDSDVFSSEVYQLRDDLSEMDEVASTESSTIIIIDALPAEKYSTIKILAVR